MSLRAGILGSLILPFLALPAVAQTSSSPRVAVHSDWTHRHVIFSELNQATLSRASSPPNLVERVIAEPRFWHQQLKRSSQAAREDEREGDGERESEHRHHRRRHVDWSVSLGAGHSALGTYPVKFTFDINASPDCVNDFAVFALNVAGSATQATIIAFDHLYAGPGGTGLCAGLTVPSVRWAYNTGNAINTSPVLSLDATKVAWVESAAPPVFHVLTIGTTGTNGAGPTTPVTPGPLGGNNAVDTHFTYGAVGNTRSSIYVDYSNDAAYVCADDGNVYKITGVFKGVPTLAGAPWPIHGPDAGNHVLTSPVFDTVSQNIFFGSDIGTFAYIREAGSTRGVCLAGSPPCLGLDTYSLTAGLHPIIDAPIVDSVTQNAFVFVGNDGTAAPGHARVLQTDTQLSTAPASSEATIGEGGADLYDGAFDNNYYTSPQTGFLYVCGYPNSGTAVPTLFRIGFNSSSVMNTASDGSSLAVSSAATQCSPMTEIFNAPTAKDWLFFSVPTGCVAPGAGVLGCVMSFDITTMFPAISAGVAESGGTSGIIIDNVSTAAQASSIYFTDQGSSAVKLTQSGLH